MVCVKNRLIIIVSSLLGCNLVPILCPFYASDLMSDVLLFTVMLLIFHLMLPWIVLILYFIADAIDNDLANVDRWCRQWGMLLKIKKTEAVIIGRLASLFPPHPDLFVSTYG